MHRFLSFAEKHLVFIVSRREKIIAVGNAFRVLEGRVFLNLILTRLKNTPISVRIYTEDIEILR